VDYSQNPAALKKVVINDVMYSIGDYTLPTELFKLEGALSGWSYNLWTYLYPSYCSGDNNVLYMDYFRIYSVQGIEEEDISTTYDVNEWIYHYEFNEFDTIPGEAVNTLPYIDVVENRSVAIFDGNRGRTGFSLSKTAEVETLKDALNKGQVAFEFRFKEIGNTNDNDGNGIYRGYMNVLFSSYYGGQFHFSQYGNKYGVLEGGWHTATALLDYSSGTVFVKEVRIDGEQKTFTSTDAISTVDKLLGEMRFWQYAGKDVKMYLDYIRIYSVAALDTTEE